MPELSNLLRQRLGQRTVVASGPVRSVDSAKSAVSAISDGSAHRAAADGAARGVGFQGDAHPDPDTLTAYAERLLRAEERTQVLNHLADCRSCREIVVLAMPEAEAVAGRVAGRPGARDWRALFSPRLGLAGAAVAAALIVGVVIEYPRKSPQAVRNSNEVADARPASVPDLARQETPASAPAKQPSANVRSLVASAPALVADRVDLKSGAGRTEPKAEQPADLSAANTLSPETGTRGAASEPAVRSASPREVFDVRATASPAAVGGSMLNGANNEAAEARGDYLNSALFTSNGQDAAVSKKDLPPAPAPRAANTLSTLPNYSAIPDFSAVPGIPPRHTSTQQRSPARSLVGVLIRPAEKIVQRQLPFPTLSFSPNNTMGGAGQLNPVKDRTQTPEVAAAPPTLLAESSLAGSSAFSTRARALPGSDAKAHAGSWRVAEGQLQILGEAGSWSNAYPADEIVFSTVNSQGPEVWAGGDHAALLHSRDSGRTWERVTLGAAASGSILKIEARGLNVQVVSSSGQSWTSVDGGKTWARQE